MFTGSSSDHGYSSSIYAPTDWSTTQATLLENGDFHCSVLFQLIKAGVWTTPPVSCTIEVYYVVPLVSNINTDGSLSNMVCDIGHNPNIF